MTLARKLAHPPSLMHALCYAIILHYFRRDAAAARENIEAVLQMAHDWDPRWIPYATLQMAFISAHESKQQARVCMTAIQEALAAHCPMTSRGRALYCAFSPASADLPAKQRPA